MSLFDADMTPLSPEMLEVAEKLIEAARNRDTCDECECERCQPK